MANCKSELGVIHSIVDLNNKEDIKDALFSLLEMDGDITENEDYFQTDTLELGFDSEADRIVKEYIRENGLPGTFKGFKDACNKVSGSITEQEYYGECELTLIEINGNKVSLVFAYGGSYGI